MSRWRVPGLVVVLALAAGGLAYWLLGRDQSPPPPPSEPPWFADITDEAGIDFVHDPGPVDDRYFMPQIVGSGAALFDCDGDGLLDIYLLNNGGPRGRSNVLYKQLRGGKFRDVSRGSGLDVAGYGMGIAIGDVDNDGRPDVVVSEYGRIRLFLNRGGGRFEPATEAGLDSALWGTSTCFFDYDRDGWLDLVVVNYVAYDPGWPCTSPGGGRDYCHPTVFPGAVAKLFRNVTGAKTATAGPRPVRFEDTTVASGLGRLPGPGLGVTCADFNGDGWPDIFVANDAQPNRLWINQRDGATFKEEAVARGLAYDAFGRSLANMGVALGDTHGEGLFDVFVTHLPEETNTLWRQKPRGIFVDATATSSLIRSHWRATGFGTTLTDFNQDGLLDVAIVNGRVVRARGAGPTSDFWAAYAERNQLFTGAGPGKFRDISPHTPALCGTANVARGLAVGDIDGDGAPDLLVTCAGGRARLLRNVAPERGHWLIVRAVDPALKRDAYGAEVTVEAGGRNRVGWINPGQSYLCSNDPRAHFGLGSAPAVDAVRVLWPDGTLERFPGGPADRVLALTKGEGKTVSAPTPVKTLP